MACNHVGGLSGAFIPVSEDAGMIKAVEEGYLNLEKLEAMTAICSVGLDMIAIPGDIPAETIAAMIADEAAIGVINHKTTAVRIIPLKIKVGDSVEFGGLLGTAQSCGRIRRNRRTLSNEAGGSRHQSIHLKIRKIVRK